MTEYVEGALDVFPESVYDTYVGKSAAMLTMEKTMGDSRTS